MKNTQKFIESIPGAFGLHVYASIEAISDRTGDSELLRLGANKEAKSNALDPTLYVRVEALNARLRHGGLPG